MKKIPEPSQQQLNSLLEHYQAGRNEDAEKLSLSITEEFPKHQFAWKVLGIVFKQMGKINESLVASQKSVQLDPRDAEAYNNLGITLQELGKLKEAEASYRQAITLKPDYAEAYNNLGIILKELGKLKEAEASYRKAIALKPDYTKAYNNLGLALKGLGRLYEAETSYKKVITLKPDFAEAHSNLGLVLKGLGRLDEAEISLRQAITLKPEYTKAYNNLGIIMQELGKLDQAETSMRQAITLKPDYAEAYNNLGLVLKGLGRLDEAETSYKKAIALKPDYAEAHCNLGLVLKELGRLEEAEASYKKAITLKPDFLEAIINRWLLLFNKKRFEAALLDADSCISKGSRQLDLTTLYALGRIDEIYKRIEVKSKTDSENITIAAFASFIAEVEKKDTAYNFCPNPIDFIHHANLSTHINDSNSYIAEVIHELDSVKTIWQPSRKTTVGGFQTPSGVNLFKSPTGKIEQLKSIIINELDVYHKKYSNKSCSYIKKWPFQNYLNGWYVVLKKQGYQSPHIHPGGWLSGVIYLKVVPSLDKNEGAIEFSLNGENYSNVNSSKVIYQPKLGAIVFFPSSLHHRTIPFSTNTDRIIVSFDLKPKQF